jgi:uncharacterized protein (DUF433 family)
MKGNLNTYIVSTQGVLGGRPRIDGTRIAVQTITGWYKKGYSPEEIHEHYEHLNLYQIYAALTYYHANQKEIERDIIAEEEEYDKLVNEFYHTARVA